MWPSNKIPMGLRLRIPKEKKTLLGKNQMGLDCGHADVYSMSKIFGKDNMSIESVVCLIQHPSVVESSELDKMRVKFISWNFLRLSSRKDVCKKTPLDDQLIALKKNRSFAP